MMTGAPPRIPVGCGAFVSFHPSMGSVAWHERQAPHGLPGYFALAGMTRSGGPNFLGAKYAPFVVSDDPNSASFRIRDLAAPRSVEGTRFAERRDLRALTDRLPRFDDPAAGDPVRGIDEHYARGYDLVTSPAAQAAFDVGAEPDRFRDAYGRNSFGQQALLARRLVEAGVPFVTINDGGWDHHSSLFEALRTRLPTWDKTVAALINDLDARGLLETTMVIASLTSLMPSAARWRVPRCGSKSGLKLRGSTHPAALIFPPSTITAPSCSGDSLVKILRSILGLTEASRWTPSSINSSRPTSRWITIRLPSLALESLVADRTNSSTT
jgi:hypothetical protein